MRKQILEIDMARGLSTLAVIAIHVSATALVASLGANPTCLAYAVVNVGARFAVPTFVVLSGLGLSLSSKKNEGYFAFLWHRLSKIVPAYLVWSLVYEFFFDRDRDILVYRKVHWDVARWDMIRGGACYHLYFVPLIVMLYLLFPLLRKAMATRWGLAASGLITLAVICVVRYVDYPSWLETPFAYPSPLNWLFYMAIGIWLGKPGVMDRVRDTKWRAWIGWAKLLLLAVMVGITYKIALANKDIDKGLDAIGPLVVLYTLLFMAWVWTRKWGNGAVVGFLQWVSKYSYVIYLCHVLVLLAFLRLYFHFEPKGYGLVTFGVAGFVFTLVGAGAMSFAYTEVTRRMKFRRAT